MPESKNNSSQLHRTMLDLFFTIITLYSVKYTLLEFKSMWTFAGPISLLAALLVSTWRLKTNNESWSTLGVFRVGNKLSLLLWTVLALVFSFLGDALVSSLLADVFSDSVLLTDPAATEFMQNRFDNVAGNIPVYIYWLMVSWIIGGFTEELLFRGFLMAKFEKLYSKLPFAIFLAVITQALIFGQLHMYYQGVEGFIITGFLGVMSGLIFVFCKRRLWPLIISHGLANTIGMSLLFVSGG